VQAYPSLLQKWRPAIFVKSLFLFFFAPCQRQASKKEEEEEEEEEEGRWRQKRAP
jgi:hypothetical protein